MQYQKWTHVARTVIMHFTVNILWKPPVEYVGAR